MVVQIEAAEAAKKEAEKAKKKSKKVVGNKGGDNCKSGNNRRDARRSERSRSRRDYDRSATIKSGSGSVALIIRPVRGRACVDQQRLISTEEGLVYTSPVTTGPGPLSPDQINITRDTTWRYKKVEK